MNCPWINHEFSWIFYFKWMKNSWVICDNSCSNRIKNMVVLWWDAGSCGLLLAINRLIFYFLKRYFHRFTQVRRPALPAHAPLFVGIFMARKRYFLLFYASRILRAPCACALMGGQCPADWFIIMRKEQGRTHWERRFANLRKKN